MSPAITQEKKTGSISTSRKTLILIFASVLLLAQAVPLLATRWVADESWYTAPADSLAFHGELRMPAFAPPAMQARVETASPVLYVIVAGVFKLLGTSLYTAKLTCLLSALAGILLTYLIGCELESPLLGLLAAVFLAVDSMYFVAARTARPEALTIFFELSAILLFLYSSRYKSVTMALLSGMLVGLAMQAHANGLAAGITAGVLAFREYRWTIWRRLRPWIFAAGMVISVIPFLLWCYSDAVHRDEFVTLYTTGERNPLSAIPSIELSRYSDFIGVPNARFHLPIPLPYRLQVVLALVAAAYFLYRYNRPLLGKIACLLVPCMFWWAYIRNQNVRYTATGGPYFALLLAGAVLALWKYKPAWRKMVAAAAMLLILSEMGSNYALLYIYRKANFEKLADRFHALIPKDATVYGNLTFWMAFQGKQRYYSWSRTPVQYGIEHGVSYLILNDNLLLHGNGWGVDDWVKVRTDANNFVRDNATLVGRVPDAYYGDLEVYRVNHPMPSRPD